MKKTRSPRSDELRAKAEAAAWLSRLQQSPVPAATRAGFQAWLSEDEANEVAFENATLIWDILPGAVKQGMSDSLPGTLYRPMAGRVVALVACLLFICTLGAYYVVTTRAPLTYSTAKGQQMSVVLSDQSRVSLNTDTLVEIAFSDRERLVRLVRGEAMFEVAKDPKHPFIVDTGYNQVRDLGTTFVVRKDEHRTSATLIEGRVEVFGDTEGGTPVRLAILTVGQRITITGGTKIAIDYPPRDTVAAWTTGQVIFEDALLGDAIEELNRYGDIQLAVDDPTIASLHISGDFTTRDPTEFARAVAALYHLHLEWDSNNIRFTNEPPPGK